MRREGILQQARLEKKLFERTEEIKKDLDPGRYESEDEYRERLRAELSESKRIIE